jgi:hypothetical protein
MQRNGCWIFFKLNPSMTGNAEKIKWFKLVKLVSRFILSQRFHEFPRDFQAISGLTALNISRPFILYISGYKFAY